MILLTLSEILKASFTDLVIWACVLTGIIWILKGTDTKSKVK
jgi:hypothetical protein